LHGFSIQFHRYSENFQVPLNILNIKMNNAKLDSDFGLDRGMLQLWICTLVGIGYIKKDSQSYANNEKGKEELRWHALRSENKMLIST
jgi:hypothetical protein